MHSRQLELHLALHQSGSLSMRSSSTGSTMPCPASQYISTRQAQTATASVVFMLELFRAPLTTLQTVAPMLLVPCVPVQ